MVITMWILFIVFGFLAIHGALKFLFSGLNWFHALVWILSIVVVAVAAGVLFGGLFGLT